MLPMKIDLTEELAATLRFLRLNHPVDGEVLTAEKLSKAIGKNRAWVSQIESRRLKKIRREDIIAIYKLLLNEKDDHKAERLVEIDLSDLKDSYIDSTQTIINLVNELRDMLMEKYNNATSETDRFDVINCLISMIHNFKYDYKHALEICTVTLGDDDPEFCLSEMLKNKYDTQFNDICINYRVAVNTLIKNTKMESFLLSATDTYNRILQEIDGITINDTYGDIHSIVFEIDAFSRKLFEYLDQIKYNQDVWYFDINIEEMFEMIISMITNITNKLIPGYNFTIQVPTIETDKNELSKIQLEITNIIMDIIKYVSDN